MNETDWKRKTLRDGAAAEESVRRTMEAARDADNRINPRPLPQGPRRAVDVEDGPVESDQ